MKNKKGFTLIELMVVILIVGILAAVAIPLMRGRIDSAKWSEGRATIGTIATALRAYAAEYSETLSGSFTVTINTLGISDADMDGTYFESSNFSIQSSSYNTSNSPALSFNIRGTHGTLTPSTYQLDEDGVWTNP